MCWKMHTIKERTLKATTTTTESVATGEKAFSKRL